MTGECKLLNSESETLKKEAMSGKLWKEIWKEGIWLIKMDNYTSDYLYPPPPKQRKDEFQSPNLRRSTLLQSLSTEEMIFLLKKEGRPGVGG